MSLNFMDLKSTSVDNIATDKNDFERSLSQFSSIGKKSFKRKRKRALGTQGLVRLLALCLCMGVLAFSVFKIVQRYGEQAEARRENASLLSLTGSELPVLRPAYPVSHSKDLLSFLGSDNGGIEMVDTDTRNSYELLREEVYAKQAQNPDCIGYITVSNMDIERPIMKGTDNEYYLHHLWNGKPNDGGAIFADYRLEDDYDSNMNTIIYGHCMTDGSMFRPLKFFFDGVDRYTKAQDMKITVVTTDAVYVYTYFSGYRSEGGYFINTFTDKSNKDSYYNFLKNLRAKNTIPKAVGYNSNSKIITLITCTNLSSKPGERYVLHGILDEYYSFKE